VVLALASHGVFDLLHSRVISNPGGWSAERFELFNAVASGPHVALEVVWTGTVRVAAGPFAAGQALRARFAVFMEFRDGRISRQRNYDCFDPW
jgi:ketosteroid isomerase-like protein